MNMKIWVGTELATLRFSTSSAIYLHKMHSFYSSTYAMSFLFKFPDDVLVNVLNFCDVIGIQNLDFSVSNAEDRIFLSVLYDKLLPQILGHHPVIWACSK